jgi:mannose-6-phosphate isomerase-like protein (cupin superfamily)
MSAQSISFVLHEAGAILTGSARPSANEIDQAIAEVSRDPADAAAGGVLHEAGLAALPVLAGRLSADAPIEVVERFEAILKAVLLEGLAGGVPGSTARDVARFQQELGFLFKYKSYAVKCATPLGYSIFFQRPREGFSFQRHVTRKTEVFHILDVLPGGYAFVCRYEDWVRAYDPASFAAWLAGGGDPRYDAFRFDVRPGDVFVIDQLNVVHTVVGCVLEEFATVSTDMVDRLYDQNLGRPMPAEFDRAWSRERLAALGYPRAARRLTPGGSGPAATPIEPVRIAGGTVTTLADTFVLARRHAVDAGRTTDVQHDDERAAILHVTAGRGRVIVADREEAGFAVPPSLPAGKADVLLIPPGTRYGFVNEGDGPFEISEHRIALAAALA